MNGKLEYLRHKLKDKALICRPLCQLSIQLVQIYYKLSLCISIKYEK